MDLVFGAPFASKTRCLTPSTRQMGRVSRGRAVEALAISFTPKDGASRKAAEAELRRSRVGRKARRSGTVETVVAVPHLPGLEDEP